MHRFHIEMDGTGVPVVAAEPAGRVGKVAGQPAHPREVTLGCVFTQAATDKEGWPVRDEHSTTHTSAIETAEEFGLRIYTEAWGWRSVLNFGFRAKESFAVQPKVMCRADSRYCRIEENPDLGHGIHGPSQANQTLVRRAFQETADGTGSVRIEETKL